MKTLTAATEAQNLYDIDLLRITGTLWKFAFLIIILVPIAPTADAQIAGKPPASNASERLIRARKAAEVKLLNDSLSVTERLDVIHAIQQLNGDLSATNAVVPTDGSSILPILMDAIQISADFKDTADTIANPIDSTLQTYDKLAAAITNDQEPPKPSAAYSIDGFAAQVEAAAEKLDGAQLNSTVDASQYSVSLQQLASCVTQDAALNALHSYVNAMDQAIVAAQANVDYLSKLQQTTNTLNSDAQLFAKAAAIGASTPDLDWADYFSSAWWDLDQHLAPAIAHLNNAAQKQTGNITNNLQSIQTQDSNLKGNLQLLQPNWCILGGNWSGQSVMNQFGIQAQAALTLTSNGTQSGTFIYNNTPMQPRSVSLTGKVNLTVVLGGATLQGTFDPKYQQFTGTLTFPGSPGLTSTVRLSGNGY